MIPIIEPGTFFQITDYIRNSVYLPGSFGVVSSVSPRTNTVWRMASVIIRRGKKGTKRLERLVLNIPIFKSECKEVKNVYMGYSNKIVHAEIISNSPQSIISVDDMEFLAWANAYTWYLQHISTIIIGGAWYGMDEPIIDSAFNANLVFNPNHPSDSYYTFDERIRLLNAVRKEEIKLVKQAYQYKSAIYRALINCFSACDVFYSCDEYEKETITEYVKSSMKKVRTIDSRISEV